MNPPADPAQEPLSWRLCIGWGIGSLGAATLINAVTFIALFYLTGTLGIAPALAGAIIFAAKCYDIVTDPLMGVVSDRTHSPWGRRRPYLLIATIICPLSFYLLFNVPSLDPASTIAFVVGALLAYATGYTVFNIPYLAMPAEMTDDYHDRSRLMSVRVVFASFGILFGGALAPALIQYFGNTPELIRASYSRMSLILAVIIGISMLACFFGTRSARHTAHTKTSMSFREQWKMAINHRAFVVLLTSKFLHMSGVAVISTALLYLVTIVLERGPAAAGVFGISATAGTIASMPLWLALTRKIGKRDAYIVGVAIYVPALLSWLWANPLEIPAALVLRGASFGIATGGLILTAQAMLPDTIADDTQRSGLHREGTFTSAYSFMEKTAFALGPLIVGLLLEFSGYDSQSELPATPETVRLFLLGAALLPAIASGLSAWTLRFYELDRILINKS